MGEGEVKGRGKWEGGTRRRNERCPENFCSVPFERHVRSKQLKVASKMKSELVLTLSTFYVAFSFFILLYTSFLNYIKIFYINFLHHITFFTLHNIFTEHMIFTLHHIAIEPANVHCWALRS